MPCNHKDIRVLLRWCNKVALILVFLTLTISSLRNCDGDQIRKSINVRRVPLAGYAVRRQPNQVLLEAEESEQRQLAEGEYENISQKLDTGTNDGPRSTATGGQRVVPSSENNGNSQVVYVNLARVVKDRNDTERVISQQQLIKQEAQITCGETNRNGNPSSEPTGESLQNRIVGGNKADPGEFPYQVRLNIRSRRGSSLCGGVIIDKRHILTAAHCMTTW